MPRPRSRTPISERWAAFPGFSAADTLAGLVLNLPKRYRQAKLAQSAAILDTVAKGAAEHPERLSSERVAAFVRLATLVDAEIRGEPPEPRRRDPAAPRES